jgi:intracellular multiplication protein IcmE
MKEYQTLTVQASPVAPIAGGAFGEFQENVRRAAEAESSIAPSEFAQAQPSVTSSALTQAQQAAAAQQAQVAEETAQDRQDRLEAIMTAMSNQATQLITAWQPSVMAHREGSFTPPKSEEESAKAAAASETTQAGEKKAGEGSIVGGGQPIIKAGAILFGVLDTAINSDYPDSPIMVTVVMGPFKGAKLLGKIVTTKGVSGQMDRVTLNFTLMDYETWPKSKTVTSYAIDPDTARTVLASSVDYHYLMRFGAMIATSFLQGYSTAITNEGTSTTGIFGTSETHPALSASNKIMVGLGQVGQTLGAATQNYINRPPTVRVDSGVSLGILFMSDVT